ncbi:tetratricopeptide repeat protein [Endothiovibrio diazotrophicus]
MSLINQMLRDLEARLPKPAQREPALKGLTARAAPSAQRTRLIFILMVLTVISAIALFAFDPKMQRSLRAALHAAGVAAPQTPLAPPSAAEPPLPAALPVDETPHGEQTPTAPAVAAEFTPEPTVATAPSATASAPAPATTPAAAPAAPRYHLTAIQLIRKNLRTRLVLALDGPAPYRVLRDDHRGLTVELESTADDGHLPPLDVGNTPLTAIERESRNGRLLVHLDFDAAEVEENRLFSLPTDREGGTRVVVDLFQPPPPEPKPEVIRRQQEDLCQSALNLARMEKLEAAETALGDCLRARPGDGRARTALAALLINGGRLSEAQPLLAEGLRLNPANASLARLQARLQVNNGAVDDALATLRTIPAPDAADYAFIAALEQRTGRYQVALDGYRQALAVDRHQGAWWLGMAISLEALNRPAEAREAYRRAGFDPRLSPAAREYAAQRLKTIAGAP